VMMNLGLLSTSVGLSGPVGKGAWLRSWIKDATSGWPQGTYSPHYAYRGEHTATLNLKSEGEQKFTFVVNFSVT
jgi:hypothetical protein